MVLLRVGIVIPESPAVCNIFMWYLHLKMKFFIVLSFGLFASAGLAPLTERQLPGFASPFSPKGPALAATATKDLKAAFFPNATRKQVLWGPLTLQAANVISF